MSEGVVATPVKETKQLNQEEILSLWPQLKDAMMSHLDLSARMAERGHPLSTQELELWKFLLNKMNFERETALVKAHGESMAGSMDGSSAALESQKVLFNELGSRFRKAVSVR